MQVNTLPFERPRRSVDLRFSAARAAIAAMFLNLVREIDYWLFTNPVETPRTPDELLAMANRLESTQPSYAADLRAAALRAQGGASN